MRMKLIESTMIWYLCSYKNDNQANKHENISFLLTTCSTFVNRSAWFWSGFTKNMLTIPATKHLCDSWYTIDTFFFFNQDSGFIAFLHSYLQPYVLTAKCRWFKCFVILRTNWSNLRWEIFKYMSGTSLWFDSQNDLHQYTH